MDSEPKRNRPARTRALALLGAAVVSCGAVAACSSGGGGGSSAAAGTSSASAGTSKTLTDITIGYPSLTIHLLPFQVAIDQGFFAQQGLKVKLVSLNNSQTTIAGLTSGSVQFAGVGSSGVLAAAAQGAPVISLLAQDNGVPQDLMVSAKFASANNLTSSSPISAVVKALGHSTFGVNGLTDQGLAHQLLGAYGVSSSGVRFASLGSLSSLITSVTSGAVDAIFASPPSSYKLTSGNTALLLGDAAKIPSWPTDIYQYVLAANRSYVQGNPAVAKEVVAAVHQAVLYIKQHPDSVITSAQKVLTGYSTSVLQQSVADLNWATDGGQSQANWNATIQFNVATGGVKAGASMPAGQSWTSSYYSG
jgi:NitT/TauT family transport system substrate-binding protein